MSTVSEVSPDDWRLWRAFRSMSEQLSRELDRRLQRDAAISQADYAVLLSVFEAPERRRRTGELGELLAWEKSRVSHQVARMEARGLVRRVECSDDARGTWVTLEPDGSRALLGAMSEHAAAIRSLFLDALDPVEKSVLLAAAERTLRGLNPAACDLEQSSSDAYAAAGA